MVGVYLAAALFFVLNNYKAFFLFKQTVLAIQYTDTFTQSSSGSLLGCRRLSLVYTDRALMSCMYSS